MRASDSKRYVAFNLQGLHQACLVESVWPHYDRCPCLQFRAAKPGARSKRYPQVSARPSISQTARVRTEQSQFSIPCVWADDRYSSSGEEGAAGSLDAKHQGPLIHRRLKRPLVDSVTDRCHCIRICAKLNFKCVKRASVMLHFTGPHATFSLNGKSTSPESKG